MSIKGGVHPFLRPRRKVVVFAHRGERGLAPENTMRAFHRAVDLGVDVLEMDIHQTADGVLVVCHDDTVDRTTDGTGLLREKRLAELQELDAGYRWTADGGQTFPFRGQGIRIPTLEAVLRAFPEMRINVDIKQRAPAIVVPFVNLIRAYGRAALTMVGSFDEETVTAFRRAAPEVPTAASFGETRRFYILNLLRLSRLHRPVAHAYQIPEEADGRRILSPHFIRAAHARGQAVHVWTVNEIADMARLIDWGVDGIMTDYPARLLNLMDGKIAPYGVS